MAAQQGRVEKVAVKTASYNSVADEYERAE